ncbi:MAG: WbqC family protein [Bacteroidales bacterium]|nr:WbqC family protein [Bacteroidales bacterium]
MLLSTAYFPPVQWFALAARYKQASVEACERYQKQSYRNRCYILAGDGREMLQVPVVHGASWEICDVLVDYSTPWVLRTQRALDTAYENSAFFEYYRDGLYEIMDSRPSRLWDLNMQLTQWCLDRLHLDCLITPTSAFTAPGTDPDDYRSVIHPKHPDTVLRDLGIERPYYQVFRDRMGGFTPGLSILDLLFNEGPDAADWILPGV